MFEIDKGVLIAPAMNSPDAPGENGRPVILPTNMSAEMKKAVDDGWVKNAFNQYASDLISIHRSLPDPRDPWKVYINKINRIIHSPELITKNYFYE